jgi:CHASE3 domain sensor protein
VLFHWRQIPGAPAEPNVEQWQIWCEQNRKGPAYREEKSEKREKIGSAELRYWEARANREERQDQVEAGDLVTKADAKRLAESIRDAFIAEGDRLPSSVVNLLKDLKKSDKQLVEQAVAAAWKAARDRISIGT